MRKLSTEVIGSSIMLHFVLICYCFIAGLCLQGGGNQDKGTEKKSGAETG